MNPTHEINTEIRDEALELPGLAAAAAAYGIAVASERAAEKYGTDFDKVPEPLKTYLETALEASEAFLDSFGL